MSRNNLVVNDFLVGGIVVGGIVGAVRALSTAMARRHAHTHRLEGKDQKENGWMRVR